MSSSDCNWTRTHNHLVRKVKASIECGFTLKRVRDMTRTYSQSNNLFYSEMIQESHLFFILNLFPAGSNLFKVNNKTLEQGVKYVQTQH